MDGQLSSLVTQLADRLVVRRGHRSHEARPDVPQTPPRVKELLVMLAPPGDWRMI